MVGPARLHREGRAMLGLGTLAAATAIGLVIYLIGARSES